MWNRKFLEFLQQRKILDRRDIVEILKQQTGSKETLEELLLRRGALEENLLLALLGEFHGIRTARLDQVVATRELAELISPKIMEKHGIIPIRLKGEEGVFMACSQPIPPFILENIRRLMKRQLEPVLLSGRENRELLNRMSPDSRAGAGAEVVEVFGGDEELPEQAMQVVDSILLKAVSLRASDIHLEPDVAFLRVRFRIDGELKTVDTLPASLGRLIISRLKVLSNMNIAERRSPQDGGFSFDKQEEKGISINLRSSTLPCAKGEKIVLRILPSEEKILTLAQLGMEKEMHEKMMELLALPYGIIFVTGPTGSGKTNTLYGALKHLRSDEVNITTVEDPIEMQMQGINQTQVDSVNRFSFGKALRTILRQDPNIIMVGEVRDQETASLALEAALTGHLVLSTLHTNDATSAIGRLTDMGCEPFLVSATVRGVLAQRLVRIVCPFCKEKYIPEQGEVAALGIQADSNEVFYRGKGCSQCRGTGYRGRTGIFELFVPDQHILHLIAQRADPTVIRQSATELKMKTLREDGLAKLRAGVTSSIEILKTTLSERVGEKSNA